MSNREQFNEAQKGRLLANFKYSDKLLLEVEEILTAASSDTAFPRYKNSLSPPQIRVIRDYMTRIRRQMLRVFADLDVPVPAAQFDSVHSIRVTLVCFPTGDGFIRDGRWNHGTDCPNLIRALIGLISSRFDLAGGEPQTSFGTLKIFGGACR
jgi:hypothetical protein